MRLLPVIAFGLACICLAPTSAVRAESNGAQTELLRAVEDSGYTDPTPIQRGAIPTVMLLARWVTVTRALARPH